MSQRSTRSTASKPQRSIEQIDADIVRLLDERARICRDTLRAEERTNQSSGAWSSQLQRRLLRRIEQASAGDFPTDALKRIFTDIQSICAALRREIRVAYFGPEATYTHMAAVREFGNAARYTPHVTVHDVFHAISKDWADFGVVPIENSTGGMVHHTLDEFLEYDLTITSEIIMDIHHNLLSKHPLNRIRKVFSHPQGFSQCQRWLRKNLPGAELIELASTAEGARLALETPGGAAIASELAASLYGLPLRGRAIEDYEGNRTRFIVLGREPADPTGRDKTSLLLSLKDRPGALYHALKPFSEARINLTKIESRPTKRKAWEYYFFIDLEGHQHEARISKVLKKVERLCLFFKILGSYPKGE
ncbi:MAG: prephenate dehydratase [Candidatus Sumerlaeia bacterium]